MVRLAQFTGGRLGGKCADGKEIDPDTGHLDVGGPATSGALGGKVQHPRVDVEDDEVGDACLVVLCILGELVDALGDVVLAAAVTVEDLALADQRVVDVDVAHQVSFAGGGPGFGVGDVVAVQEQKPLQVEIVDFLAVARIGLKYL